MNVARDKLGEYVLFAGEFNRYEEFAVSSANYAWVDEADKDATHPGQFRLKWEGSGEGTERVGLIRSDVLLGASRPVRQVIFDMVHVSSVWEMSGGVAGAQPVPPQNYQWRVGMVVTPVLVEFDPSDISWNDAYVTDGGLLDPASLGVAATCLLVDLGACIGVTPVLYPSGDDPPKPPEAWAAVDLNAAWPGMLVVKIDDMQLDWNDEEAIYGFELRIKTWDDTVTSSDAMWEGDPSDPNSVCYVIRK